MTRDRLTYLLLLAGVLILHIMLVDYISYVIVIFFILLPPVSLLLTAAFCRGSTVSLRVGVASAAKGEDVSVELRVKTTAVISVRTKIDLVIRNELTGEVTNEAFVLAAGRRGGVLAQSVSFARPGKISLRIERTGVYDPLGMVCLRTNRANREGAGLLVMPDVVSPVHVSGGGISHDTENDGLMQVVKGDDPSELYDIREYQHGDRVTRIHWKLSERTGRLLVKEFGRVVAGDALIMFDLNCAGPGGAEEADAILTALASVSASFLEAGVACDVEWYGARGNALNRDHIERAADRDTIMASILSESGLTSEPFVLKSKLRASGRNSYSKVIYLCSQAGMNDGDPAALIAKMAAAEMSIMIVSGGDAPDDAEAVAAAAPMSFSSRVSLSRVAPSGIEAALKEAVL
ncbi:MAG: DUF58 domain-containing protein [Clostridiales Family XIII bacterium]|jgi:uncharacterized protein (DUF58 family)|nr:DUF58 domain-containing protein [Clostridiales Family XIII bacterium]